VDDRLHRIARQIAEDAEDRNAVIVVGDPGGIRKDNDKGWYVNDRTHEMPFARLVNCIEYKAHDAGIDVQLVIVQRDDEPANLSVSVGATPGGEITRL